MVRKILFGHSFRRKALLETHTYPPPIEFAKPPDGLNRFGFSVHDKAGSVIDNFGDRAGPDPKMSTPQPSSCATCPDGLY
jgi:hypothetical protein